MSQSNEDSIFASLKGILRIIESQQQLHRPFGLALGLSLVFQEVKSSWLKGTIYKCKYNIYKYNIYVNIHLILALTHDYLKYPYRRAHLDDSLKSLT